MTDRRSLSIRKRVAICLRQDGKCAVCGAKLRPGKFEIDHIAALVHDGDNRDDNLRAICTVPCHREKTKTDVQAREKVKRVAYGGRQRKSQPMLGSKASGWKQFMDGHWERRGE